METPPRPTPASGVLPVTVAVPTYGRGRVLIDTLDQILAAEPAAAEVLVLDQTPAHDAPTRARLERWSGGGRIRWLRLSHPSHPAALNRALLEAAQPIVVFVDDDIAIAPDFVLQHALPYADPAVWAVAGQVLQPGQREVRGGEGRPARGRFRDVRFPFNSATPAWVENGMEGNLSVRRERALAVGGFDENFLPPVSYRFGAEFCKRLCRAGGRIRFAPAARVRHLRAARGGTRSLGSHLTSASPVHGLGDYYFALGQGASLESLRYILRRPVREVATRFHLRHPWWIPVKLVGELRALLRAARLRAAGPRTLPADA